MNFLFSFPVYSSLNKKISVGLLNTFCITPVKNRVMFSQSTPMDMIRWHMNTGVKDIFFFGFLCFGLEIAFNFTRDEYDGLLELLKAGMEHKKMKREEHIFE